jgi:hypothetical protein
VDKAGDSGLNLSTAEALKSVGSASGLWPKSYVLFKGDILFSFSQDKLHENPAARYSPCGPKILVASPSGRGADPEG